MNIYLSYSNVRQRGVSISNMSSGNLEVVIYIMILFCTNFLFDVKKRNSNKQTKLHMCILIFINIYDSVKTILAPLQAPESGKYYMHILQNNNDENNELCFIVNVLSES